MSDDLNDRLAKLQARRVATHGSDLRAGARSGTPQVGDPVTSAPDDQLIPPASTAVNHQRASGHPSARGKRRKPAEATRILTIGVASSASLILVNLMAAHAPSWASPVSRNINNTLVPGTPLTTPVTQTPGAPPTPGPATAPDPSDSSPTTDPAPRSTSAAHTGRVDAGAAAPAPQPTVVAPTPIAPPQPTPTAAPPPVTQAPPPPTTAAPTPPPPPTTPTRTCPSGAATC